MLDWFVCLSVVMVTRTYEGVWNTLYSIESQVDKCKVSVFANDCIIYQSGNKWEIVREKLQLDFDKIITWTGKHFLTLNNSKTQTVIIGSNNKLKRLCNPRPVSFAGEDVKFVKQYNYLGIILDDNMSLQSMLKHVKKKNINNQVFFVS